MNAWRAILVLLLVPALCFGRGRARSSEHVGRRGTGGVAVLIYHHFVSDEEATRRPALLDEMTMSATQFAKQLDLLAREGAHPLTAAEFTEHLTGVKPAPPRSVLLVIDDGYESVYRIAWPMLKARGIPALVALIVSPTESPAAWQARHPKSAPHLTWDQVNEMLEPVTVNGVTRPLIALASHTHDMHEHLARKESRLGPAARRAFRARLLADLTLARQLIARRTGHRASADYFVWPHGGSSAALRETARAAGHRGTFTDLGPVIFPGANPLDMTRVHAGSGTRRLMALSEHMREAGW